jgi:hypothetical protein
MITMEKNRGALEKKDRQEGNQKVRPRRTKDPMRRDDQPQAEN